MLENKLIKINLDYSPNYFEIISFLFVLLYYGSVVIIGGGEINFFNKFIFPFYVLFLFWYLFSKYYRKDFFASQFNKLIFFVWLITIYFNYSILVNYSDLNIPWLLGDLAVIVCLLLSIIIGKKINPFKDIKNYINTLVYLLFSLILLDFLFNYDPQEGQLRMYSRLMIVPTYFLYQFFTKKENIYFFLYLVCLILSIFTNMRYPFMMTSFLLFLFISLFSINFLKDLFKTKNLLYLLIFIGVLTMTYSSENSFFMRWRFFQLFSSDVTTNQVGLISTFAVRYFEVVDTISHIKNTFNPFTIFFGNGAGAAFKADLFWTWANNDWYNINSFSSQSNKHILHFGPVRIFFRYGIFGLILVGIFFVDLIRYIKNYYSKVDLSFVIAISLFVLSLRFFIQPIFNDLLMSILIIAFYSVEKNNRLLQ